MSNFILCIGSSFLVAFLSCIVCYRLSENKKNKTKVLMLLIFFLIGAFFWGIGPQFFDYADALTVSFIGIMLGIFFIIAFFSGIAGILFRKILVK